MNTAELATIRLLEIGPDQQGQRIDNFLARLLKGVPRSLIYRILRTGQVRVNSGRIRPDYRLQSGDTVRLPPVQTRPIQGPRPPPAQLLAQLRDTVLLEDGDVLVLNKPAGIAVHKGSGLDFGVIETLRALRPELTFLELGHRLDRETSGCLVLFKNATALRAFHEALRTGTVSKRYLTLVRGRWEYGTREIDAPLRKVLQNGEQRVVVMPDGKPARTLFRPVTLWRQASLLEALPATGRTHQIRVHAAQLGHPVAGDDKYGDSDYNQVMNRYGLRRLFLHAHSLDCTLGRREYSLSAPLEAELRQVLDQLEQTA
jgi:23S rRNA pseudouridine955/2504/2580 synthase